MRLEFKSLVFIGVMLGAAMLSLLRVLVLAAILPKVDFAGYAATTATGAFMGTLISFGAVEGTIKAFPRMIAAGKFDEMRQQAHRVLHILILRAAALGAPIFLLGYLLANHWLMIAGAAFLFALSAGYTSVVASMQRAVGNPRLLASGTVFRALLTFVAVVAVAQLAGMTGVLATEACSALLGCYLSERMFLRPSRQAQTDLPQTVPEEPQPLASLEASEGVRVFLAYTLVSVPFYLDRLYVTGTMGADSAAQYAVLALFLMGASLLVNTVAQRVGPDAIKLAMSPSRGDAVYRYVLSWCAITSVIWLAGLAFAALLFHLGLVPSGLAKYQIEPGMLLPLGLLGVLFNTALLEFLMIALDQERQMLRASIIYVVAVFAVAAIVAVMRSDLYVLLWMLAGARLLYGLVLTFVLRSHRRANKALVDG